MAFDDAVYTVKKVGKKIDNMPSSKNMCWINVTTHSQSYIGTTVRVKHTEIDSYATTILADQGDGTGKGYALVTYTGQYSVKVISPLTDDTVAYVRVEGLGDVASVEINPYILYGVHVDGDITDPSTKVTPIPGCQNENFAPVQMDFETGIIDGGDWFDVDIVDNKVSLRNTPFFFPRSCMLSSAGRVVYYLDETDETKTEAGTASDVANSSFDGNAMMEWGQDDKIIYMKVVPDSGDETSGSYYFSDKKLDSGFKDYAFRDKNNELVPHFYTAKYFGSGSASKMRSLSGQANFVNDTAANEIAGARANGADIWDTTTLAQWNLINGLLILMAGTTDTQTAYGSGRCKSTNSAAINTGTMDGKGMFWGSDDETSGVKVFGMENWWGNLWRRIRGYINANGTIKIKMTRGTQDGSTASDYNTDGTGYITLSDCTPSGTNGGYISEMKFTEYGMFAKVASGSDTTFYTDGLWFDNSQSNYAVVGGHWSDAGRVGALYVTLNDAPSGAGANVGSALSCTPLAS